MNNDNDEANQEVGRGEKIYIYISGVVLLILFGGFFGYLFYMGMWIALD